MLTIRAAVGRDGDDLVARCTLEGERQLPGSAEPQRVTHYAAAVRLTATAAAPEPEHAGRGGPGGR